MEEGSAPHVSSDSAHLDPDTSRASEWLSQSRSRSRVKAAYRSVCDGVAVHPHLGIHVDQVPAEGFTLQPLPQGLPVRDVAEVDPRVLESDE